MKNGHRPMRRQKREVTSPEELRRILEKCQILRIGAMDEKGMFVVPVNYGFEWEDELLLYYHSAKEGRKADAFHKDPNVAFELDSGYEVITGDYACSYSAAYESIMGNGTVTLLETPEKKERALTLLMKHAAPGANLVFRPEMLEAAAVYCLRVSSLTGKRRERKQ